MRKNEKTKLHKGLSSSREPLWGIPIPNVSKLEDPDLAQFVE